VRIAMSGRDQRRNPALNTPLTISRRRHDSAQIARAVLPSATSSAVVGAAAITFVSTCDSISRSEPASTAG